MFAYLVLLAPLGFVLFLVSLLFVYAPWGRTVRRVVGKSCLVAFIAGVMMWAVVSCWLLVVFLHDGY
jgi:hypothetical protein